MFQIIKRRGALHFLGTKIKSSRKIQMKHKHKKRAGYPSECASYLIRSFQLHDTA